MKLHLQKIAAVLLAAAVLGGTFAFAAAGKEQALQLTVTADVHYMPAEMTEDVSAVQALPGSRLYSHVSSDRQMYAESDAILAQFLAQAAASGSSAVLIAGDLTDGGQRMQHQGLAQRLAAFEASSGKQVWVINGNHDIRDTGKENHISPQDFKTIYADFGYAQALDVHDDSVSYTAELDGAHRLLAIDSCVYDDSHGRVKDSTLAWVRRQAAQAKQDGKQLVAMMHHGVLNHFRGQKLLSDDFVIDDYRKISAEWAELGIKIVFTGHFHANDISSTASCDGNALYDVQTASLISYPCVYREAVFAQGEAALKTKHITEIDTSLLPAGYSAAQLELLENDFPAYAFGYLQAGFERMIDTYVGSTRKMAQMLKLDEDSLLLPVLDAVLPVAANALKLPIYNDGSGGRSIESIAASACTQLPASQYTEIAQLVAAVMGTYFAGDENMPYSSTEITLLLQCVKGALSAALADYTDMLTPDFLQPLAAALHRDSAIARMMFTRSGSLLARLILKPILEGITVDFCAPQDNDTVIPYK